MAQAAGIDPEFDEDLEQREPFAAYISDDASQTAAQEIATQRGWATSNIRKGGLATALRLLGVAPPPRIMIVDIEGGEGQLFRNFSPGRLRHVYVELHKQVIGPRGLRRVFNQLARAGFAYDPVFSAHGVVTFTRSPEPAPAN